MEQHSKVVTERRGPEEREKRCVKKNKLVAMGDLKYSDRN